MEDAEITCSKSAGCYTGKDEEAVGCIQSFGTNGCKLYTVGVYLPQTKSPSKSSLRRSCIVELKLLGYFTEISALDPVLKMKAITSLQSISMIKDR